MLTATKKTSECPHLPSPETACEMVFKKRRIESAVVIDRSTAIPCQRCHRLRVGCFYPIAKLCGFADTKLTGRPSGDTIWHGWFRLRERIDERQLSKLMFAEL